LLARPRSLASDWRIRACRSNRPAIRPKSRRIYRQGLLCCACPRRNRIKRADPDAQDHRSRPSTVIACRLVTRSIDVHGRRPPESVRWPTHPEHHWWGRPPGLRGYSRDPTDGHTWNRPLQRSKQADGRRRRVWRLPYRTELVTPGDWYSWILIRPASRGGRDPGRRPQALIWSQPGEPHPGHRPRYATRRVRSRDSDRSTGWRE